MRLVPTPELKILETPVERMPNDRGTTEIARLGAAADGAKRGFWRAVPDGRYLPARLKRRTAPRTYFAERPTKTIPRAVAPDRS